MTAREIPDTPEVLTVAPVARFKTRPLIFAAVVPYVLLVLAAIRHHEPWADEAQSWLLGRDASLVNLWGKLLHYEGSPGLWQTLVHVLIRLGVPYSAYNFVSAGLSLVAVILLLRYAPLPPFIRCLLPFTYYLCYQYAVIARSYALIAPLLFAIAAIYLQARRRVYEMTALLILLAGVSVHGFLISICICGLVYGPMLIRGNQQERTKLAIAGAIYGSALFLFLVCAWPAKDVAFAEHRGLANLAFLPDVTKAGLAGAFTGYWIPSLVLVAITFPVLWRGGGWLFFVLATAALCLFGAIVYAQLWHFGILFLIWLFAIWISAHNTRLTFPAQIALTIVIGFQCYWTALAIGYDWNHRYSGSAAAAHYLKTEFGPEGAPPGGLYAVGFSSTAVQPYFGKNIFSNFDRGTPAGYWDWSQRNAANDAAALFGSQRREAVLVGYKELYEKQHWAHLLAVLGYGPTQHFDGATFWQTGTFELESYDLYRQTSTPQAASSVKMGDPARAAQLLNGFYAAEGETCWTAKNFSVFLKAPEGSGLSGANLNLRLYVPGVQIQKLGVMTLKAEVGSRKLPPFVVAAAGLYVHSWSVPAEALRSGFVVVRFELNKASVGLNGDSRELGVVVTDVGLEPKPQAH